MNGKSLHCFAILFFLLSPIDANPIGYYKSQSSSCRSLLPVIFLTHQCIFIVNRAVNFMSISELAVNLERITSFAGKFVRFFKSNKNDSVMSIVSDSAERELSSGKARIHPPKEMLT
jgi:hypothetical protein